SPARVALLSFFFTDPPTPQIYTLSLHDALPISWPEAVWPWRATGRGSCMLPYPLCSAASAWGRCSRARCSISTPIRPCWGTWPRSEEHTSELQSLAYLVCRLLLEKKKKKKKKTI